MVKKELTSYLGLLLLILATWSPLAQAAEVEPSSSKFLSGKIVFDIQLVPTAAKHALVQLKRIRGVHERLGKEGIKPQLVVVVSCPCEQDAESVKAVERMLHPAAREELRRVFEELTGRPGIKVYVDEGARGVFLEWKLAEGLILAEDAIVPLVNYQMEGYALVPAYAPPLR